MKTKILLFTLFSLPHFLLAGVSDSIDLTTTVTPICEVSFSADPIASNLDLVNSQSSLNIGRLNVATNATNGPNTTPYRANLILDFTDTMQNGSSPSNTFTLTSVDVDVNTINSIHANIPGIPLPVINTVADNDFLTGTWDFAITYTGVPALTLVQGVYSATWYASCSVEER